MIQLRLSSAVLARTRFAYSPLAEAVKSLYLVHSGTIHPLHRGWYDRVRGDLRRADNDLLGPSSARRSRCRVPLRRRHQHRDHHRGSARPGREVGRLAHFRSELERAWRGVGVTPAARRLLEDRGRTATGRRRTRALLGAGTGPVLAPAAQHPRRRRRLPARSVGPRRDRRVAVGPSSLTPGHRRGASGHQPHRQRHRCGRRAHAGALRVRLAATVGRARSARPAQPDLRRARHRHALGRSDPPGPIARTRSGNCSAGAGPKFSVGFRLPRSTTDLAQEIGLTPATVSSHLSILRRNGLVTCWRSGRRVLYQRTALASMMVSAGTDDGRSEASGSRW